MTQRSASIRLAVTALVAVACLQAQARSLRIDRRADGEQPAPSAGQSDDQRPASFRGGVDVVTLNITAVDTGGRYISDLRQDEFVISEDGIMQRITFFSRSSVPIALAILLDSSASMENKLPKAQEAALGFIRRLRSQDLAEIVDFNTRVAVLQNFTSNVAELERAIRRTKPGGATALYSAVYTSLKDLTRITANKSEEIRRQAIVLLTDGEDTTSQVSFEQLLDLTRRSQTAIYAIGLRADNAATAATRGAREAEVVLRQLAQESGGRVYFADQASELTGIYAQIAAELASQYTLGYSSSNTRRDGAWRSIHVRVSRPNLTTRSREGYFAPMP